MSAYTIRRPTSVGLLSRGRDYSVRDLGTTFAGYTDLLSKELGVSLDGDSPLTRWVQLHELSHVKHDLWSPGKIMRYAKKARGRELSLGAVLAAMDVRINERLVRRVHDAHEGFRLPRDTARKLRMDLEGYVASHASPRECADTIRPSVDPAHVAAVDAFLARVRKMPDRELTILRVVVPLAELIDDLKAGKTPKPDDGKPESGKGKPGDGGAGKPTPVPSEDDGEDDGNGKGAGDGEDDEPSDDEAEADDPSDGDASDGDGTPEDEDAADGSADGGDAEAEAEDREALGEPDAHKAPGKGCAGALPAGDGAGRLRPWVIPEVCEPPLTVPMKGGNYMVTTAETGTVVRWAQLHRIQTDGVVFRRARRRPGALQRGTVLIDVSSSMSFTDASLAAIVDMLPYATVAIYSGDGDNAWIVVVARNGKRVASMYDMSQVPRDYANTCDGPALLWLSRQASPRLWVCDGLVTGACDKPESWQYDECATIMEAASIVQVCGGWRPDRTWGLRATRAMRAGAIAGGTLAAQLKPVLLDIERGRI